MILEIDTSILDRIPTLTINQLVFTNLLLNDIKNIDQNVQQLLSRVNEEEIEELVQMGLATVHKDTDGTVVIDKGKQLDELFRVDKSMFDEFYERFPVYVMRPDGTKGFLRANINKCRKEYNRIIGKSKAMHKHLIECLEWDIQNKMSTGKLGYMKTMWKWLTQHEWETFDEQMKYDNVNTSSYGTNII